MSHELCELGATELNQTTGSLAVQAKGVALSEDENDAPDYGQVMFSCALGVSAAPYPRTDEGAAEAIIATDVPGLSGVAVAARDLRSAKIVGNLGPGDTVLHSTGPQQAAQVQCKEEKRQTVMVTKDTRGKSVVVMIDGKNDVFSIAGMGMSIRGDRENGITLSAGGAGRIQIKGGDVIIEGRITFGGRTPIAAVAGCAPGNVPPGPATQGVPIPGLFYGAIAFLIVLGLMLGG